MMSSRLDVTGPKSYEESLRPKEKPNTYTIRNLAESLWVPKKSPLFFQPPPIVLLWLSNFAQYSTTPGTEVCSKQWAHIMKVS